MLSGENEGHKEEDELGDRKVYRRRSFKGLEDSRSSNNLLTDQAMVSEGMINSTKRLHNSGFDVDVDVDVDVDADNFSSVKGVILNKIRISLSMKSKREALELRRKLEEERDMVRNLMRKIEANQGEKNADYSMDEDLVTGGGVGPPRMSKPLNQLSLLVCDNNKIGTDNVEKEKRTPKVNKMYRNSEFLLAKDKIPPPESNKKLKSNGKKGGRSGLGKEKEKEKEKEKFPIQVFKSCTALLERLMKHKHGWVFNKPVDAVALGLHDYFDIIKNPMDLGTVKDRLTQNWYNTPVEFAEDVRLTFHNAMTYNPKGQDVYVMAEQLSQIFAEKWAPIEADYTCGMDVGPPLEKAHTHSRARPHMKKTMDRSESLDPKRKTMNVAHSGKASAPKKPKAKDPNKREMTYDEKQKLSVNLQNLPSEKLEKVVHIIKKRNPSVSQQDDEIEVDIDSVDTETLWELDRFITNYKKSLSKNKRKAEIVSQSVPGSDQNTNEKAIYSAVVTETPKGSKTDEEKVVSPRVEVEEPGRNETNQVANRSSSSSDSGSSSSDSDGESSSIGGSDGKNSPKN